MIMYHSLHKKDTKKTISDQNGHPPSQMKHLRAQVPTQVPLDTAKGHLQTHFIHLWAQVAYRIGPELRIACFCIPLAPRNPYTLHGCNYQLVMLF